MPSAHVQMDAVPSAAARRFFLRRLFGTFLGVLVLVLLGVFTVQLRDLRGLLEASDLAAVVGSSLRWLALGVVAAVPVLYFVGGRALARRFADSEDRAARDTLTGLSNDASFREALRHEVARTQRFSDPFTLAVVNVDDFSYLNEDKGHDAADDVLVKLAQALRTGRSVDLPFRLGGDEFAVIMPHTDLTGATWAVTRIRQEASSRLGATTVSVGLAQFEPGESGGGGVSALDAATALRDHADLALHEAKRRGRNAVVSFAEIEEATGHAAAGSITLVRQLLRDGRLVAAYQPIWDLDTRERIGFAARALAPVEYALDDLADVFDAARWLGVVDELDELCRTTVLAAAAELPAAAFLLVPVAAEVFDDDAAADRLRRAVELAGLTPGRVILAFGDRSGAPGATSTRAVAPLRELGFSVAYGSGGLSGEPAGAGPAGIAPASIADVVQVDGARGRGSMVIVRGLDSAEQLGAALAAGRASSGRLAGRGELLGPFAAALPGRDATPPPWPLAGTG